MKCKVTKILSTSSPTKHQTDHRFPKRLRQGHNIFWRIQFFFSSAKKRKFYFFFLSMKKRKYIKDQKRGYSHKKREQTSSYNARFFKRVVKKIQSFLAQLASKNKKESHTDLASPIILSKTRLLRSFHIAQMTACKQRFHSLVVVLSKWEILQDEKKSLSDPGTEPERLIIWKSQLHNLQLKEHIFEDYIIAFNPYRPSNPMKPYYPQDFLMIVLHRNASPSNTARTPKRHW